MLSGKVSFGIVASVIAIFFLSSCVRYENQGPAYSTGHGIGNGYNNHNSGYIGAISGHIHLYDQYGSPVTTGLAGIQVSLTGFSVTTITDNTGYYRFYNAPNGTYNLYVHDTSVAAPFADTKVLNVQLSGDSVIHDISLSAVPSFAPSSISVTLDTTTKIDSVVLTFTSNSKTRAGIVFVNNNSAVNNLPANYLKVYTVSIPDSATSVSLSIPSSDLYNLGLASGSTVYLAAYGYVTTDYSVYEDYSTGKNIYNAVSTSSATASAKVP
jgi:hypothetical protein